MAKNKKKHTTDGPRKPKFELPGKAEESAPNPFPGRTLDAKLGGKPSKGVSRGADHRSQNG